MTHRGAEGVGGTGWGAQGTAWGHRGVSQWGQCSAGGCWGGGAHLGLKGTAEEWDPMVGLCPKRVGKLRHGVGGGGGRRVSLGVSRTALQACRAVGARDGVQRRHGVGVPNPPPAHS